MHPGVSADLQIFIMTIYQRSLLFPGRLTLIDSHNLLTQIKSLTSSCVLYNTSEACKFSYIDIAIDSYSYICYIADYCACIYKCNYIVSQLYLAGYHASAWYYTAW